MEPIPQPTITALPKPAPIDLVEVRWSTVSVGENQALALSAKQYENLSTNFAEILRWVKEANSQLDHYREEAEDGSR